MTHTALQVLPHPVPPHPATPVNRAPALTLITARPTASSDPRSTHVVRDYALLSATGAAITIVLGLLAPAAAREQAFAALAAATSFVLLASAPFARCNWQRALNAALACMVFALSVFAVQAASTAPLALSLAALGSLAQIQFSSEHNWRSPGVYWPLFITASGLLLFILLPDAGFELRSH